MTQEAQTPKLSIQNLTKYFGTNLILHSVNLDVAPHEVVCLIGASGSGKSTLLRCINRLFPFDYGHILLDGVDIEGEEITDNELRKRIGIVFQSYNLFPHMTVLDNITLAPRKVHGIGRKEAEARAHELLELFGLEDYAESYPDRLSGGQQQRVAIVRAITTNPDVLLLDEVTAALDPELIGGVLNIIRDLKGEGMTMMIVTHEMGFARDVADRVCFLDEGRILEEGEPARLFSRPENPRTQQFLQRIIEAGRL
jgi:polar amino acid transport system ATP-binding protein